MCGGHAQYVFFRHVASCVCVYVCVYMFIVVFAYLQRIPQLSLPGSLHTPTPKTPTRTEDDSSGFGVAGFRSLPVLGYRV